MCLAIPAKIIAFGEGQTATVMLGNVNIEIQVSLLENPQLGDYVIVHAGFALSRLDQDEAEKTLALFNEIAIDALPERKR